MLCASMTLVGCFAPVNDTHPYTPPIQIAQAEKAIHHLFHVIGWGMVVGVLFALVSGPIKPR